MKTVPKILVLGNRGMVGSAIVRELGVSSKSHIITVNRNACDLTQQGEVEKVLKDKKPDEIYFCAGRVGGIYANKEYPAEFIYENLIMQCNVVHGAFNAGIKKLLLLGSSCIYPKHARQPIKENALLTGPLEKTNEPYAIAKIAGIIMCQSYNRQYGNSHFLDYRCVMPTNLYGPGDNYHEKNSHVLPSLIKKIHEAKLRNKKNVILWGTGEVYREFLHVDDLAKACIFVMSISKQKYMKFTSPEARHINVGSGFDLTIKDLASKIKKIVGYNGQIKFDSSFPDGTPRKLMDSSIIQKLGWSPSITLDEGIKKTFKQYLKEKKNE